MCVFISFAFVYVFIRIGREIITLPITISTYPSNRKVQNDMNTAPGTGMKEEKALRSLNPAKHRSWISNLAATVLSTVCVCV